MKSARLTALDKVKRLRQNLFVVSSSSFDPSENRRVAYWAFAFVIIGHCIIQMASASQWLFGSSMWAEMALNYYPNSISPSWLQRLFAPDAGYIPLPQRLIALLPVVFRMSATSIPFFYSWAALFATALLVGSFCLPQFRVVVRSDCLRAACALSVLFCSDFETRNFINFTYFGAFFIAVITALALSEPSDRVPWWAWFIPLLFFSKPAVMAALPALVATALVTKGRFRWITAASLAVCTIQVVRLAFSQVGGTYPQTVHASFFNKIIAICEYIPAMLGAFIAGPAFNLHTGVFIVMSVLVVLFLMSSLISKKGRQGMSLVLCGVSLLAANIVLNCITLSDAWNTDLHLLTGPPIYRHIIAGFFGCVMVVCGIAGALSDGMRRSWLEPVSRLPVATFPASALLFIAWFVASGWLHMGGQLQQGLHSPLVGNSQWDVMAEGLDRGRSPICIPVDPLNWVYGSGCQPMRRLTYDIIYKDPSPTAASETFDYKIPGNLSGTLLYSVGVLVRPNEKRLIGVRAVADLGNGNHIEFSGQHIVSPDGGMVTMSLNEGVRIADVKSLRVMVDSSVDLAFDRQLQGDGPLVLLMGQ